MAREAKPFKFTLSKEEAAELLEPSGQGGHQGLHKLLLKQLKDGNRVITLTDTQLGKLLRYMTMYKSGGFQGRLRKAFRRSLSNLIAA